MPKKKTEKKDTEKKDIDVRTRIRRRRTKRIIFSVVGVLLFVIVFNFLVMPLTGGIPRTGDIQTYTGENEYIAIGRGGTMLSAHRAGGDLAPEETMQAFELCMDAEEYKVDIVEFDVHLTEDEYLVLLHDHEVDRTSDGEQVFGERHVKVNDKTLAELKTLNFGYNFTLPDGSYPYREEGRDLSKVRILELDELLGYLEGKRPENDLHYIIEIKDEGSIGKKAMDRLYALMEKHGITGRTVVGTFNGDITDYIDSAYGGKVSRSAGVAEVLKFYFSFLYGVKPNTAKLGYRVLQIPVGLKGFYDLSTAAFIDYAHSVGIAVQYWTINDPSEIRKLASRGADAVMTDNPEAAYGILTELRAAQEGGKQS